MINEENAPSGNYEPDGETRRRLDSLGDYEICLLYKLRNDYRRRANMQLLAYYYNRSIIRYMARLVFSIGWGKIREQAGINENRTIYEALFTNQGKKEDSIEPGTFAFNLKQCAYAVGLLPEVREEVDLLFDLGKIRNTNAHEIKDVDFSEYYFRTDLAIARFSGMMEGKMCSYIIPVEYVGRDEIRCDVLKKGYNFPEEILRPRDSLDWSAKGNRLFYSVVDGVRGEQIYSLSPMIEIPDFILDEYPHFRVYERVKDYGYGSAYDILCYDALKPKSVRRVSGEFGPRLSVEFEQTCEEYDRSALLSKTEDDRNSVWKQCLNGNVFINISSYPGYEDVIEGKFKYCAKICPARDEVLEFCRDRNKQVAFVTGNGGVGKTALVLSILNEFLVDGANDDYTNLIFLSAKKNYYEMETARYTLNRDQEADIHSYPELIFQLAELLRITYTPGDVEAAAEAILQQTERGNQRIRTVKKFLMVIDDLDSLSGDDQRKIKDFIYRMDARVFKTIVTTRDIADSSPVSYQVKELSPDESLVFARWYAESVLGIASWDGWSRKYVARDWIAQCGEGNPLTIQMLLVLVKAGMEETYKFPATQQERKEYLYNTVQNLLNSEEKLVLELCRQLYQALPDGKKDQEMLLAVPKYLAVGCGISEEKFERAERKLVQLKLLRRNNNGLQFQTDFNTRIADEGVKMIPTMYRLIWKDVREHADEWLVYSNIEKKIVEFLISVEDDRKFDILTAKRIFECILDYEYIYEGLKREIVSWMGKHTIRPDSADPEESINRLIQSIENRWESLKKLYDADPDARDPAAEDAIGSEIRSLTKLLNDNENKNVSARLAVVRREVEEYL